MRVACIDKIHTRQCLLRADWDVARVKAFRLDPSALGHPREYLLGPPGR